MKFLIMPDTFKGSIENIDFCFVAEKVLKNHFPDAECLSYPIADGGEGSIECIVRLLGGHLLPTKVTDGNFFKKTVAYGFSGDTAYIAVANSSGLPSTLIKDPLVTTTYGLGEHILHAKNLGKKKIVISLGGSSTNDGGAGMLAALGVRFLNADGEKFIPTGGTLKNIHKIEIEDFLKNIDGLTFTALCDVKNPLLGPNGCSYVFAPQKGAKTKEITDILENNMRHYASATSFLGVDPSDPGNGAAGGLGYAVKAFLKGNLISGIDYILDMIRFENIAADADYILTGEGCFDLTSLNGKVVGGIAARAQKTGKKITVFCGRNNYPSNASYPENIQKVYEISDRSLPIETQLATADKNLEKSLDGFCRELLQ